MTFPKYEAYKDSGVEWLGDVPVDWQICAIKRKFNVELGKMLNRAKSVEDGITKPYLRAANIHWDKLLLDDLNEMEFSAEQMSRYQLKLDDLLVTEGGVTVGRSAIWEEQLEECYYQNSINRVRPRSKDLASTKFLLYWMYFLKMNGYIDMAADIATFGHLTQEKLQNLFTTFPAFEEQIQIVRFLDHETARIDALIAEQERLIELLKEKRQAVISHAVTKGLDPTAPMKDSGVEWLGEVPAHWKLSPLKHLCEFYGGGTPSKEKLEYWNGDIPWVSPKDMKSFLISDTMDKITREAITESSTNMISAGALLVVVRSGILQRTIPVAINKVPVTLNQDMKALCFSESSLSEFIAYFIKGLEASVLLVWRKQGATVESIEFEYLSNTVIPVPPICEVDTILSQLRKVDAQYDALQNEALFSINLLQERRSALISAAVTGKIDVRGWQVPESDIPAAPLEAAYG